MKPEQLPSMRDRIRPLVTGIEADHTTDGLHTLLYRLAKYSYRGETPPEFLFHVEQTALVTDGLLKKQPDDVRNRGRRKVYGHDIGRAVSHEKEHTVAGARILQELRFEEKLVQFSLSHYHWGLGVYTVGDGNFSGRVADALSNGGIHKIVDEIVAGQGIETLAALVADNSKTRVGTTYATEIHQYTLKLAYHLIQSLVDKGRLQEDSLDYRKELLGARFLDALIPEVEKRLDVSYPDVIAEARSQWPQAEQAVIAKWNHEEY